LQETQADQFPILFRKPVHCGQYMLDALMLHHAIERGDIMRRYIVAERLEIGYAVIPFSPVERQIDGRPI
jgi:hypothetical protein